ncbi:radical SAM enzyme [Rhodocollybia butyracea]|uniref:Radical SAM enzyme n=1 Tax=Rhodocollybia butyracea TaxID=206335 RepID=A0A9P5Q595_9AGAR|nr:radical SAM enzyme [Rhodocollybia butyracea]
MDFVTSVLSIVKIHLLPRQMPAPVSVNYFPHRKCNYSCEFCFHTTKNLDILSIDEAKRGLRLLSEAGMKKLNISGGEPFLKPDFIGEIFRFCKEELGLESCTVVNNGSKVTEAWLDKYGRYLDNMALSVDSFDDETNIRLGRAEKGKTSHTRRIFQVADWCRARGIKVKLNSVITRLNWEEDMNEQIADIQPFRWKVFQVLLLKGENTGAETSSLRDARDLVITPEQFQAFLDRHSKCLALVPESNSAMQDSYLLLDENMCFLNCENGEKKPGHSILEVGVHEALKEAGWDEKMFRERGGVFDWSRVVEEQSSDAPLEW